MGDDDKCNLYGFMSHPLEYCDTIHRMYGAAGNTKGRRTGCWARPVGVVLIVLTTKFERGKTELVSITLHSYSMLCVVDRL